jgi:signal transduction histidine kinase
MPFATLRGTPARAPLRQWLAWRLLLPWTLMALVCLALMLWFQARGLSRDAQAVIMLRPASRPAVMALVDARMQQSRCYGLLATFALAMLAMSMAWRLDRRIGGPLREIVHTLDAPDAPQGSSGYRDEPAELLHLRDLAKAILSTRGSSAIAESERLRIEETALQGKARFMAQVGDHFRQPLQALELFATGLRSIDGSGEAIGHVHASIERMTHMLDALLTFSKLDAGVHRPVAVALDIDELFRSMDTRYRTMAQAQATRLAWRAGGAHTEADPALLGCVLGSLIDNALAAAPGGTVLVAARVRQGTIRFEVRDNGRGIPSAHQQRIFEEFVQLPLGDGERPAGYGLGLAIAVRAAQILETRIDLTSRPGHGSCFWFMLPCLQYKAMPASRAGLEAS